MISTVTKSAIILLAGFLIGLFTILFLSFLFWNLHDIKSTDYKAIGIPSAIGGLTGLIIAFLLLKTNHQNQELKANELKLRALIELSLDGIYLENERGEILDCNTAGHKMFGYTREEMLKLNIRDLVPDEFAKLIPDIIPESMATGDEYLERENKKKDGTIFPTEVNTKFVNLNGEKRLIAYVRDNTKQKKSEAALKEVIETKNKLFSIIGHDLKGSFSTIQGFSDILMSDLNNLSEKDTIQYLKHIHRSANQANNLLENLLNWAMIQTDRVHFSPEQLPFRSIVTAVFNQISDQANSKDISLICNIDEESLVWADRSMLRTILRNLLANAIKYSYPNSQIEIKAHKQENNYVISVLDQGTGMTSATIENLFKSCQTKTTPGTNNEIGTGLGLIICKEFAEKHGGCILVDSIPEKGTTFHIELPVNQG